MSIITTFTIFVLIPAAALILMEWKKLGAIFLVVWWICSTLSILSTFNLILFEIEQQQNLDQEQFFSLMLYLKKLLLEVCVTGGLFCVLISRPFRVTAPKESNRTSHANQ